jgi:peptide deformylase
MDTLPITKYPNPILRQRSEEILDITPTITTLAPQMIEAMTAHDGVGLAGPQVDIAKRIIIVLEDDTSHVFLNPKILKAYGEKITEEEGCLSLPGLFIPVTRYEKVDIECQTLEGDIIHIIATDLLSRIFQHEVDHLDGKLIINRINLWQRFKIRKELDAFKTS